MGGNHFGRQRVVSSLAMTAHKLRWAPSGLLLASEDVNHFSHSHDLCISSNLYMIFFRNGKWGPCDATLAKPVLDNINTHLAKAGVTLKNIGSKCTDH